MKKRVKLTFPQKLIKEPVIFKMAMKYQIIPSIRHALVTDNVGEMILEIEGKKDNIEKGIQSLKKQGIDIEFVDGEIFK